MQRTKQARLKGFLREEKKVIGAEEEDESLIIWSAWFPKDSLAQERRSTAHRALHELASFINQVHRQLRTVVDLELRKKKKKT